MGKKHTQLPDFIKMAQTVLLDARINARPDFAELKKGLPVLAAKMNQAGEGFSVESLLETAQKGAIYVRELADNYHLKKKLSYEGVIKNFPVKEAEEATSFSSAVRLGNLNYLRKHTPNSMAKHIVSDASQLGHLNLVEHYFEFIDPVESRFSKLEAVGQGHIKVLQFFNQQNVRIKGSMLHYGTFPAAENGHLDVLKELKNQGYDLKNGAVRLAQKAVKGGHLDIVKYIDQEIADFSHEEKLEVLEEAVEKGRLDIIKYFNEQGVDIKDTFSFRNLDVAVWNLVQYGFFNVIDFFVEKHGEPSLLCEGECYDYKNNSKYQAYKTWKQTAQAEPPPGCIDFPAELFKDTKMQETHKLISDALRAEGYEEEIANRMAFTTAVLFKDDQTVLRYLKTHGTAGKQPLHDVVYMLKLPSDALSSKVDWDAWRSAVLMHGPKMAKLFKFADKVSPVRSPCGKNWAYYETLEAVSEHAYAKAADNPSLSSLFLKYSLGEDTFNDALEIIKEVKDHNHKSKIPDISFSLPNGMKYKKLEDGDIRGLVLGEITDCCQTLDNHGDECVRHGFTSENGGFYVVLDKNDEIIGQSWAWLGRKGELVLDSLETLGTRINAEQWTNIAESFVQAIATSAPEINALHIGRGGETPDLKYEEKAAKPKDYKGYRDSKNQYRVWKR